MKQPEHHLQVACFRWFACQYPKLDKLFFAVPNGGMRNKIIASKLKREGVKSGVSDTFLAVPKQGFNGFFIEFKAGKNTLSDNQKEFIEAVDKVGYKTAVVYSFDEFEKVIKDYLK